MLVTPISLCPARIFWAGEEERRSELGAMEPSEGRTGAWAFLLKADREGKGIGQAAGKKRILWGQPLLFFLLPQQDAGSGPPSPVRQTLLPQRATKHAKQPSTCRGTPPPCRMLGSTPTSTPEGKAQPPGALEVRVPGTRRAWRPR